MGRLLMQAMMMGGHTVFVASELRSFLKQADDPARTSLVDAAEREIETMTKRWEQEGAPDLWFCYHPYYKAPDLLGRNSPAVSIFPTSPPRPPIRQSAMPWAGRRYRMNCWPH